jgi:hypothetical protein
LHHALRPELLCGKHDYFEAIKTHDPLRTAGRADRTLDPVKSKTRVSVPGNTLFLLELRDLIESNKSDPSAMCEDYRHEMRA